MRVVGVLAGQDISETAAMVIDEDANIGDCHKAAAHLVIEHLRDGVWNNLISPEIEPDTEDAGEIELTEHPQEYLRLLNQLTEKHFTYVDSVDRLQPGELTVVDSHAFMPPKNRIGLVVGVTAAEPITFSDDKTVTSVHFDPTKRYRKSRPTLAIAVANNDQKSGEQEYFVVSGKTGLVGRGASVNVVQGLPAIQEWFDREMADWSQEKATNGARQLVRFVGYQAVRLAVPDLRTDAMPDWATVDAAPRYDKFLNIVAGNYLQGADEHGLAHVASELLYFSADPTFRTVLARRLSGAHADREPHHSLFARHNLPGLMRTMRQLAAMPPYAS